MKASEEYNKINDLHQFKDIEDKLIGGGWHLADVVDHFDAPGSIRGGMFIYEQKGFKGSWVIHIPENCVEFSTFGENAKSIKFEFEDARKESWHPSTYSE